jgi:hypothetical protein
MTQTVVFIFVLFLIVAFLWEARKKEPETKDRCEPKNEDDASPTADQALPTQTGRFRAQPIVERVSKHTDLQHNSEDKDNTKPVAANPEREESSDPPLPDPFGKNGS